MATITDFARMCNSQISCEECSKGKINDIIECNQYICSHPECADTVLNEWVRKHPIKVKVRRVTNNGIKKN